VTNNYSPDELGSVMTVNLVGIAIQGLTSWPVRIISTPARGGPASSAAEFAERYGVEKTASSMARRCLVASGGGGRHEQARRTCP
jgi:hypothetical protein